MRWKRRVCSTLDSLCLPSLRGGRADVRSDSTRALPCSGEDDTTVHRKLEGPRGCGGGAARSTGHQREEDKQGERGVRVATAMCGGCARLVPCPTLGPPPHLCRAVRTQNGATALHAASVSGNVKVVSALLAVPGINVNAAAKVSGGDRAGVRAETLTCSPPSTRCRRAR